eukprot:m.47738 g.47738  ORF g.47738 m.47738 type:complete len:592 (+) comp11943_c1_seq2:309-2084(+)
MADAAPLAFDAPAGRARRQLQGILSRTRGNKELVLDPALTTPLNHVAGFKFLQAQGVSRVYKLESKPPTPAPADGTSGALTRPPPRVYVTRPSLINMKLISAHVNADARSGRSAAGYVVIMVPQVDALAELVLEEEGVYGLVQIEELQLDLVPLDDDLLSAQLHGFVRDSFLHQDFTQLGWTSRALLNLEQAYGVLPIVHGIGERARIVADQLSALQRAVAGSDSDGNTDSTEPAFAAAILIDRAADLVTPMCSQLVYTGLVDEIYGFNGGLVDFGEDVTGSQQTARVQLSSQDEVYVKIRDLNFSKVGQALHNEAKRLGASYDERKSAQTISQIKQFVSKLGGLQSVHRSLKVHTYAAEHIMKTKNTEELTRQLEAEHSMISGEDTTSAIEWLEQSICRQLPLHLVLQAVCLLSCATGGLKPKLFEQLRRSLLHSYGYEQLVTLDNLQKMGLLMVADGSSSAGSAKSFPRLRKRFNLTPPAEQPTTDMCVYYGYCPASVALVNAVCTGGGEDLARLLGMPVFSRRVADAATTAAAAEARRPILVCFLGGATCSELAALRALGKTIGHTFVVATTDIVTGKSFIDAAIEQY